LKQKQIIQKTIAIFLALVFFISAAPKTYFHDLVADHKDFSDCRQPHHSTVLHEEGINCHFDDLVVSAPFLLLTEQPEALINFYFSKTKPVFYSCSLSYCLQYKESRGPPQFN
jgi:hypothetical protein